MDATLAGAGVLVDGILGTGATGAPREGAASLIRRMNAAGPPILALDLPSGIDPTTGAAHADAIRAAVTVTFGFPKSGLLFFPARGQCGRLVAVEIGFPPLEDAPAGQLITPGWARARLPARDPDAHKGSAGTLVLYAGRAGMGGAAGIAGHAAYRAGAGLVRIVSPEANRELLQALVPTAVFAAAETGIDEACAGATAVVAGPGIGTDDVAREALRRVLDASGATPVLLDADALNLFGRDTASLAALAKGRPVILTPHPKEMARLTVHSVKDIRARPMDSARAFADATGCIVLLKGQPSVVASPGEPVRVNTVGSSDVAKAGMGDQLAGTTGALLAAGVRAADAAALGLFYAGRAADLVARGRSLIPADVSDALVHAFADPGADASPLGLPFVTFDQPERR